MRIIQFQFVYRCTMCDEFYRTLPYYATEESQLPMEITRAIHLIKTDGMSAITCGVTEECNFTKTIPYFRFAKALQPDKHWTPVERYITHHCFVGKQVAFNEYGIAELVGVRFTYDKPANDDWFVNKLYDNAEYCSTSSELCAYMDGRSW